MTSRSKYSSSATSQHKIQLYLQLFVIVAIGFFEFKSAHLRMSYGDAPFCFFQIVVEKNFWVPHDRYTGYLMQWLPVLGIKLNMGYQTLYYLYALNSYVTSLLLIYFYSKISHDNLGIWVLILTLIMGMSSSYYYYAPDHSFGYLFSIFFILFSASLIKRHKNYLWLYTFCSAVVCIMCNLYHSVLLFVGLIYILIENRDKLKTIVLQFGIIIGTIILIKFLVPSSGYERGKLDSLKANLSHIHELDNAAFRYYFNSIFGKYKLLNYLYSAIFLLGIYRRKFLELGLGVAVYFVLFYLNCLYNYEWESNAYMDLYGRIIFISILLCTYFILQGGRFHWSVISGLFVFMLYINANLIYQKYDVYNNRYEYITNWLEQMNQKEVRKLAIDEKQLNYQILLLDWALAYETLAISTFRGIPSTICAKDLKSVDTFEWKKDVLYGRFNEEPYTRISNTHFKDLPKVPYRFITDSSSRL